MGHDLHDKEGRSEARGDCVGLAAWETATLEAPGKETITITATPCRHGPVGSEPITGPVVGFSLAWAGQEHGELSVTGDTVLYGALREVASRLRVGTMLLHLGSVRFRYLSGWIRYTMDAREGAELIGLVKPTRRPGHLARPWRRHHVAGVTQSPRGAPLAATVNAPF